MVAELLDGLEDQSKKGKRAGSSWKSEAWVVVVKAVKEVTPAAQKIIVTRKKCNDKVAWFRNRWKVWVHMMNNSGWAKDKDTGLPVSSQQGMDDYLSKHPEGKKFLHQRLEREDQLDFLFAATTATGANARAVGEIAPSAIPDADGDDDEEEETTDETGTRKRTSVTLGGGTRKRLTPNQEFAARVDSISKQWSRSNEIMAFDPITDAAREFHKEFAHLHIDNQIAALSAMAEGNNARLFLVSPAPARKAFVTKWMGPVVVDVVQRVMEGEEVERTEQREQS